MGTGRRDVRLQVQWNESRKKEGRHPCTAGGAGSIRLASRGHTLGVKEVRVGVQNPAAIRPQGCS